MKRKRRGRLQKPTKTEKTGIFAHSTTYQSIVTSEIVLYVVNSTYTINYKIQTCHILAKGGGLFGAFCHILILLISCP